MRTKKLLITYITVAGILLGIIFIGLNRKSEVMEIVNKSNNIILSQEVFEYGEGYAVINVKNYIENIDDFYTVSTEPMTIKNKDIGIHEVKFTVTEKDKKDAYTVIKNIEIKDTQPAKIYLNNRWVESDYCGPVLASVMDPVDGLLDYKENMTDSDRGYYTAYQRDDKRVIKAIDKNGNVSEVSIDNYSGNIQNTNSISEITDTVNNDGCVLDKGFDNILYNTQEQAIEAAREYFNLYQAQENSPKSFNVYVTSCGNEVYYIWDFMW